MAGRFDPLFKGVRNPGDTAGDLVDKLSVEGVCKSGASLDYTLLVQFRHLGQTARRQAAQNFLRKIDPSPSRS